MADTTISQLAPIVKENNGIRFESLNGIPAVLSTEVARHFQKRHSHILRDIERLRSILPKSFNAPNFGPVDQTDAKGEKRRAFLLTRAALSLLVMGMTGKAAIMWKLRYIEAFNEMEAALRERPQTQVPTLARSMYSLNRANKRRLRSAVRYRKMGLGVHAIAKLLDSDSREIFRLLKAAVVLGFLEPALGVGVSPAGMRGAAQRSKPQLACGEATPSAPHGRGAEGYAKEVSNV